MDEKKKDDKKEEEKDCGTKKIIVTKEGGKTYLKLVNRTEPKNK
jgi:hypothetical protein